MSNKLLLVLALSLILRILISTSIYSGDLNNHVGWGRSIIAHGFADAYDRDYVGIMQPTYPPVALYAFTTSVGLYQWLNGLIINFNKTIDIFPSQLVWVMEDQNVEPAFTKVITIVTDLGIGVLIYIFTLRISQKKKFALLMCSLYVFNPAVWYISALWGQIESVPLFFILLGIYYLRKNFVVSVIAITFAILSKQTSIIFLPFYIWIVYKKHGLSKSFQGLFIALITFWLMYMPFNSNPGNILFPVSVYINRLQTGSGSVWISDHAFNLWALYSRLEKIPDSTTIIGIPTMIIGYIAFLIFSSFVFIKFIRQKYSSIFIAMATVSLIAFMVLTKMHERYSSPAIPLTLLAAIKKPWLIFVYVIVSIAHLLNVYHEWYFPRIHPIDQWLMSWNTITQIVFIFTLALVMLFFATLSNKRK